MNTSDFTTTFFVPLTPQAAYEALLNVRGWWSGLHEETIVGKTEKLNDEFTFHAGKGAHYTKQKLIEQVPGKKIVWLVTDSKLTFVTPEDEWTGTKIIFGISEEDGKTKVHFTHSGLVPAFECYDACTSAWNQYMQQWQLKLQKNEKEKSTLTNN